MNAQQTHYSILIQWSDEDQTYIASLPEWGPYAHTHGDSYEGAARHGQEVLEMLIESHQQRGEPLPEPSIFTTDASASA